MVAASMADNPNLARDHLANERTFLAWVRTGVAIVVFGFAIGRFAIALRQLGSMQGKQLESGGLSVVFGTLAIVAGVALTIGGLIRYRRVRAQLDRGEFEAAGFIVDMVAVVTALFGLALAAYLVYIGKAL
jgi:putative membrane protein